MNNWPVFVKFKTEKRKTQKGKAKAEKTPLNWIEINARGIDVEPEILETTWMLIVWASLQPDCFMGALRDYARIHEKDN